MGLDPGGSGTGEESGKIGVFLKVKSNISADGVDVGYKKERRQE